MVPSSSAPSAGPSDAQSPATGIEGPPSPSLADGQDPGASSDPREQEFEVDAPRMAATVFPSWDAFFAYFAVYQRQTYQVMPTAHRKWTVGLFNPLWSSFSGAIGP